MLELIVLLSCTISSSFAISGGFDAKPNQFPYAVQIFGYLFPQKEFIQIGSIVDRYHILTANTWFLRRANNLQVHFGPDLNPNENGTRVGMVFSEKNATILRLCDPIKFDETVAKVNLPENDTIPTKINGTLCGWGQGSAAKGVLQCEVVEIYSEEICAKKVANFDGKTQFCGGNKKIDSGPRFRDIGSPFVIDGVQIGLLYDFSLDIEKKMIPRVFLKVSTITEWIRGNTQMDKDEMDEDVCS